MRINNNLMAMNTHRQLGMANNGGAKSMEKLSSGFRINRAGDDAAGLAISEKMRGQIRGLTQASRNSQDGISMIQTAEGALNETHAMLQRMRELAVQAGNDTNADEDRAAIQAEMDELVSEIDHIAESTTFNGINLLKSDVTDFNLQIGYSDQDYDKLSVDLTALKSDSATLAVNTLTVDTAANATTAITAIDAAIKTVSTTRSTLGANQNRLEHTIKNLDTSAENLQAAESRIRDVDMAKEMMELTKQNILQQASTAMLAQANQAPQGVLQLLR